MDVPNFEQLSGAHGEGLVTIGRGTVTDVDTAGPVDLITVAGQQMPALDSAGAISVSDVVAFIAVRGDGVVLGPLAATP